MAKAPATLPAPTAPEAPRPSASRPAMARPPSSRPARHSMAPQPLDFAPVVAATAYRVGVYGPGGIGKTTLAAYAPGPIVFFDLDGSLPALAAAGMLPQADLRVATAQDWPTLRAQLAGDGWEDVKTIVVDSLTRAEELCLEYLIETKPFSEKGIPIDSIEGYGYGKGYQYLFDMFLPLLADLEAHTRAGRHVVTLAHDCTSDVPNPAGEDFIRYEPRLSSPKSGKASIRLRVREWLDALLFLSYDVDVQDGKGTGSATRTLWPYELPSHMAKSRTLQDPRPITHDPEAYAALWAAILPSA